MNPELITRVVSLIQKNGDKVVLADPTTGKAVVVMDLEAYEKLCAVQSTAVAPVVVPVAAPAVAPAPFVHGSPTFSVAPVRSEMVAKMPVIEVKKMTEFSEIPPKKKSIKVTAETMGVTHIMADLTQEELIDKINRDIGAWKTAQDRRRTDELKSVAKEVPQFEAVSALEEEERFYLEPIE